MQHKILNKYRFLLSQLVIILNSFLTQMDEIIRTTTKHGGWTLDGILKDGTFKYCPTFFMQLYTKHGTVNGNYL